MPTSPLGTRRVTCHLCRPLKSLGSTVPHRTNCHHCWSENPIWFGLHPLHGGGAFVAALRGAQATCDYPTKWLTYGQSWENRALPPPRAALHGSSATGSRTSSMPLFPGWTAPGTSAGRAFIPGSGRCEGAIRSVTCRRGRDCGLRGGATAEAEGYRSEGPRAIRGGRRC